MLHAHTNSSTRSRTRALTRDCTLTQVMIGKLQSQMRRMKLELSELHKLNKDRIKLAAIMDQAPIETSHPDNESAGATFLTDMDPGVDQASSRASLKSRTSIPWSTFNSSSSFTRVKRQSGFLVDLRDRKRVVKAGPFYFCKDPGNFCVSKSHLRHCFSSL